MFLPLQRHLFSPQPHAVFCVRDTRPDCAVRPSHEGEHIINRRHTEGSNALLYYEQAHQTERSETFHDSNRLEQRYKFVACPDGRIAQLGVSRA